MSQEIYCPKCMAPARITATGSSVEAHEVTAFCPVLRGEIQGKVMVDPPYCATLEAAIKQAGG